MANRPRQSRAPCFSCFIRSRSGIAVSILTFAPAQRRSMPLVYNVNMAIAYRALFNKRRRISLVRPTRSACHGGPRSGSQHGRHTGNGICPHNTRSLKGTQQRNRPRTITLWQAVCRSFVICFILTLLGAKGERLGWVFIFLVVAGLASKFYSWTRENSPATRCSAGHANVIIGRFSRSRRVSSGTAPPLPCRKLSHAN